MNATKEGFRVTSTLWMPSVLFCKLNARKPNCAASARYRQSCSRKPSVAGGSEPMRPIWRNQNQIPHGSLKADKPFGASANVGLYKRVTRLAGTTTTDGRGHASAATSSGRVRARRARAGLLLGAGLLVLGRSGMDMDRRSVDDSA